MTPASTFSTQGSSQHLILRQNLQGRASCTSYRPSRRLQLICLSQRNNSSSGGQGQGFAYESLQKAVLAINRIIFDYEQRRTRAKAQAAAAGTAPPAEMPQKGQLVSFRATARHEKLVKEPGLTLSDGSISDSDPDPSRSLQAYLALPLDQYSLLDPRWITRDPGGDDLFLLRVPLQDVVGLALEPQITVRVNIDSRNSQVQFLADKFKVGDPKFDEDFRVDMKAQLKRKPVSGMRSFRLPNPWRRARKAAKTSQAVMPAAVGVAAADGDTAAAVALNGFSSSASYSTVGSAPMNPLSAAPKGQAPFVSLLQVPEQQDCSLQERAQQQAAGTSPSAEQVASNSNSLRSNDSDSISTFVDSGNSCLQDQAQVTAHPAGQTPDSSNAGSSLRNGGQSSGGNGSSGSSSGNAVSWSNSSSNENSRSSSNCSRPGFVSSSPFARTVQQYSQQGGRTSVQSRSKASMLALDAEIASTATAWRASGGAVTRSLPPCSSPDATNDALSSSFALSSPAAKEMESLVTPSLAAAAPLVSSNGLAGLTVVESEGASLDAAAAAATASGSGRSMDVPGATAFLAGSVDVGFTVMVPHPLSIVPRPLLYMTGSLIARFALQSLLPSFLDLLSVDYSRWAAGNGAARSQPAGNLITADMEATAAATAAASSSVAMSGSGGVTYANDEDGTDSNAMGEEQLRQMAEAHGVREGDNGQVSDHSTSYSSGSEQKYGHKSVGNVTGQANVPIGGGVGKGGELQHRQLGPL